jgi:hypothetical protein
MNRKRDYISEILDIRARSLKRADRWNHFAKRMDYIVDAFGFLQKSKGSQSERLELLKYISIGTVACLEGYLRSVFRDLVEHGLPFEQNARKFQDVKLDLGIVFDLRQEKISYGEFVAHLLPFNNIEDINKNLSILIGSDFLDDIKNLELELFKGNSPVNQNVRRG